MVFPNFRCGLERRLIFDHKFLVFEAAFIQMFLTLVFITCSFTNYLIFHGNSYIRGFLGQSSAAQLFDEPDLPHFLGSLLLLLCNSVRCRYVNSDSLQDNFLKDSVTFMDVDKCVDSRKLLFGLF